MKKETPALGGDSISVIITTYKRDEYLSKCFTSLLSKAGMPVELIIVDGGSGRDFIRDLWLFTDGAWTEPLNVKTCTSKNRISAAEAINIGYAMARSRHVVIANDDIEIVTPDWDRRMIHHAEQNPDAGIIGVLSDRSYLKQNTGDGFDCEKHLGETKESDQVSGIFCYINRRIWDKIGTYDERYGYCGGNDADYSIRVQAHGYKVLIAQDIKVLHKRFGTTAPRGMLTEKYDVQNFLPRNIPHCIEVAKRIYGTDQ